MKIAHVVLWGLLGFLMYTVAYAEDKYTLDLTMKDGEMTPLTLYAPAGKVIRINVHNVGKGPVEFESTQLVKEKVLAPGASSVVVIAPKKPGTYVFFDDFHLNQPQGKLIVQ
ncbi:cupredoxin domain-containing protein [Neisseriaceae bacterium ESL0693]|nr:cupredoxin domain-containing protein [Neisseriaceae bacterium ESL0693]